MTSGDMFYGTVAHGTASIVGAAKTSICSISLVKYPDWAILAHLIGTGLDTADTNAIVGINKLYLVSPGNVTPVVGSDTKTMIDPGIFGWTLALEYAAPYLHAYATGGEGKTIRWKARIVFDAVKLL